MALPKRELSEGLARRDSSIKTKNKVLKLIEKVIKHYKNYNIATSYTIINYIATIYKAIN